MLTSFVQSAFYRIVNDRLLSGRRTVLSSNLSLDELGRRDKNPVFRRKDDGGPKGLHQPALAGDAKFFLEIRSNMSNRLNLHHKLPLLIQLQKPDILSKKAEGFPASVWWGLTMGIKTARFCLLQGRICWMVRRFTM